MNAAVAQERWQGQIIDGKYPLLEWLGGSANTAVFRTQLPGSAQSAAIKLVRAENTNAAQQISRWKELAALSHPNLLQIFDAGQCQITGAYWLYCVMEFAEENLDQVLPIRPLLANEVAELLPPLLDALSFLHTRGLVHTHIQPSNVFAVKNQLKLSADAVRSTNQTAAVPKHLTAYDAPESESGSLSGAADVWSVGMTLATAFNQRPLSWSRSGQLGPAIPKSIPSPYRLVAAECLRISAEDRCSLQRIKELLAQEPVRAQIVPPEPAKRKMVGPMLAVVAIAIVGLAIVARKSTEKQLAQVAPAQQQSAEQPASPNPPAQSVLKPSANPATANSKTPAERRTTRHHDSVLSDAQPKLRETTVVSDPNAANPGVVNRVLPNVAHSARETIHGKVHVKVRLAVAPNGDVSSASLSSPGPSRYFARLALEASKQWKFAAAGNPSQWLLEWKFGRGSTEVNPVALR